MIKQLSVFLENRPGRLNELLRTLAHNDINIISLSIAETGDYGIVRFIVADPNKALKALEESEIVVKESDVLALEVKDEPGTLYKITNLLTDNGVNMEYTYAAYPMSHGNPVLIVKVKDLDKAKEVLAANPEIVSIDKF